MKLPQFKNKEEKFKFLKENKQLIIDTKKAATKFAECVSFALPTEYKKEGVTKSMIDSIDMPDDIEEIVVKVVINTTNIVDSHDDCHIPGIWKKSLKDSQKGFYLLQEHNMTFSSVISDTVNAYTKKMSWASLGIELSGDTEALIFEAKVSSDRNEFMFNQYLNGWVKEHSVGMRYINLFLCINTNDKFYAQEKANWDKYFPFVANKDDIEEEAYFWAVTEAKIIEGSAVLKGSNYATPTISVNIPKSIEPDLSTQITAAELSLQESRLKTKQLLTQLIKNQI
jgi:hypothetical protein